MRQWLNTESIKLVSKPTMTYSFHSWLPYQEDAYLSPIDCPWVQRAVPASPRNKTRVAPFLMYEFHSAGLCNCRPWERTYRRTTCCRYGLTVHKCWAPSSVFCACGGMSRGLFSRVCRCGLLCLRAIEYDHCHVLYIFRFPHWCTQIIVTCSPLSRPQIETQFLLILLLSFFEHQRHEKQICRGCPGYLRRSHWLSMGLPGVSVLASTGMQKAPATVNG